MAESSTQRPVIREGSNPELCRIDLRKNLDETDTLLSAEVEQVGGYDLLLGTVFVGASEEIIDGLPTPAGKWVEFTVANHLADDSPYRLKVKFNTNGGIRDKSPKEDFVFDVVGE